VRHLEDELGGRLLDRSARGLTLTETGARLFAEAEPALALLDQAERTVHDPSGVSGRLRVSLPPHFEPLWSVFRDFGRRHAGVSFEFFVTDRRIDLVADGIDVAIRVGEGGRSSYVGRTLARYRHRVVAAPDLLEGAVVVEPSDLAPLPCACWRSSATPAWQLGETTVPLEPFVVTNDYRHLLHLALHGGIVTELPPFLAHEPLARGHLVEVLPHHPMPQQAVRALVADTRLLPPPVRHFLDFAAEAVPAALEPFGAR
jgi:DNA-binding transcriptional LysR family regulator